MKTTWGALLAAAVALPAAAQSPAHDEVLRYFKSGAEKQVKDAIWTSKTMFKVGVFDDGSPRKGYAMYVCNVLAEAGIRRATVQVIDIRKLKFDGKWVKLGEHVCG